MLSSPKVKYDGAFGNSNDLQWLVFNSNIGPNLASVSRYNFEIWVTFNITVQGH